MLPMLNTYWENTTSKRAQSILKQVTEMKKIYSMHFPPSINPAVKTTRGLPSNSFYPLKYADTKHTELATGNIVRQRFITYDFLIDLFESDLYEDLQIEVAFNKSCVLFYYGLTGSVVCEDRQSGSSDSLPAGQYGAINSPAGKYHLTLARGYSASFIFIFDTEYLGSILKMAPSDFRPESHFRIGSPYYHRFPFFTISSIGQLYQQLTAVNSKRKSISLKMALFNQLKQYGQQLAGFKNKPSTDSFEKVMLVKHFIELEVKNGPLPAVSELARQFNSHPDTLNRAFKNNFGVGIKKYINQTKMNQAFLFLQRDKLSIMLVSEMMGYNSASSFSTQFRSYYGFPPGKVADKKNW